MSRINGIIVKLYNKLIATRFINRNNKFCRRLRAMLFHNICRECKANFGKNNPDKLFYVVRCPNEMLGLMGLYNYVIEHIMKAEKLSAIPVVDWKHYPNSSILNDCEVGKVNAWNFYFEDISGVTLEDVYKSKNVIMDGGEGIPSLAEVKDEQKLRQSHDVIEKYIRLNKDTKEYFEEYYETNIKGKKTLGVLCRGTDFANAKPKWHSICPTVEQTINVIKEKEQLWGAFDRIFLATEDKTIYQQMKDHYGEKLLYNQSIDIDETDTRWLNTIYDDEKYQKVKKLNGRNYLTAVYLLANCEYFISPIVGGTLGVMRVTNGFKDYEYIDLGSYE